MSLVVEPVFAGVVPPHILCCRARIRPDQAAAAAEGGAARTPVAIAQRQLVHIGGRAEVAGNWTHRLGHRGAASAGRFEISTNCGNSAPSRKLLGRRSNIGWRAST